MKTYRKADSPWLCGHWNGSPLEIGLTGVMRAVPPREVYHYHDYAEYYVVLQGRGTLLVEGREMPLEAESVVMVQAGERHRVAWVDPDEGIRWVVIKERSAPGSKNVVAQDESASS